ncbi:hypothetical protein [Cellulomonas palmilytica]|uniref:hypothetical protein n=1 Tax=Cellulomonas palmilytica TaxID=2608402 RepID=UPI001F3FB0C6|nr:hypothetical protein [Cellulomonas palmilytica]UJP39829.1 hypothetical protein F1D97_16305 [Cellulomonas palmilytica]
MSGEHEAGAGSRRTRWAVLAGVGALVVALGAVVAVNALDDGDDEPRACSRTADAPAGGTVQTVAQGAQLVVGEVRLGVGGLSEDGCAVTTFGDVSSLEVGERVEVAGVPVVLLGVEARGGDQVGGAFEARVWVGAQQ